MFSNYIILNIVVRPIPEGDKSRFPCIGKPNPTGGYSVSPQGHFERGDKRKRYIVVPPTKRFPLSLKNQESMTSDLRPREDGLRNLLYFMESASAMFLKPQLERFEINADFVCTREVLQLMMCAPYETKENWSLAVTRYRNTIYMCRVHNEQTDPFDKDNLIRVMYNSWLKKLHQHCLSHASGQEPTAEERPGQFYGVFLTEISGLKVLFDAPVLAESAINPLMPPSYPWAELQLRQDKMNRTEWSEYNRSVALKWWADCFLAGIEGLYIANRDEEAFVHSIKKTFVRDLWKECENEWLASACANFMVRLLGTMRTLMSEDLLDCPKTVYLFEFEAQSGRIIYKIFNGGNQYTFVSDWFCMMLDDHWDYFVKQKTNQ